MYLIAYDAKRLINFALHVGAALTDADVDNIVKTIETAADAVRASTTIYATTVVVADTDAGPNAKHRKRIGEALKKIERHYQVLVTRSVAVRAIMTAIRWFSPASSRNHQATFATYPEARAWLVEHTGYAGEVFDEMFADLRARAASSSAGAHP